MFVQLNSVRFKINVLLTLTQVLCGILSIAVRPAKGRHCELSRQDGRVLPRAGLRGMVRDLRQGEH